MPTLTDQEMFYSAESRELIRLITERIEDALVALSLKRAKSEGRALVTDEDVMASFEQILVDKLGRDGQDAG